MSTTLIIVTCDALCPNISSELTLKMCSLRFCYALAEAFAWLVAQPSMDRCYTIDSFILVLLLQIPLLPVHLDAGVCKLRAQIGCIEEYLVLDGEARE